MRHNSIVFLRTTGCGSGVLLLLVAGLVLGLPAVPKIYVFPDVPDARLAGFRGIRDKEYFLLRRLLNSSYYTSDIEEADYYWIPHNVDHWSGTNVSILDTYAYVKEKYPGTVWNSYGRIIVTALCDHGPGDCMYKRPILFPSDAIPHDVNPANLDRKIIFLMFNGHSDRRPSALAVGGEGVECLTCFQPGKDIMIATMENVCGPLCGYTLEDLQRESVWSLYYPVPAPAPGDTKAAEAIEAKVDAWLERPRKYLFFSAGRSSVCSACQFNGRYDVWNAYRKHPDYLIHDTCGEGKPEADKPKFLPFYQTMQNATFCFSPPGQDMGDPDRYVAALMFGCIPVMLVTVKDSFSRRGWPLMEMALPFEEVIDWREFSVLVHTHELEYYLDSMLRHLVSTGRAAAMRQHMKTVWKKLLYSTAIRSYFGEGQDRQASGDAFDQLMLVLASRLRHPEGRTRAVHRVNHKIAHELHDTRIHGRQFGSSHHLGRTGHASNVTS